LERKRGKLLDLNKLLVGDCDAFPSKPAVSMLLAGFAMFSPWTPTQSFLATPPRN